MPSYLPLFPSIISHCQHVRGDSDEKAESFLMSVQDSKLIIEGLGSVLVSCDVKGRVAEASKALKAAFSKHGSSTSSCLQPTGSLRCGFMPGDKNTPSRVPA